MSSVVKRGFMSDGAPPSFTRSFPNLASLFADEGLELVNHQRRNAVQEHPLGKVTMQLHAGFQWPSPSPHGGEPCEGRTLGQPLEKTFPSSNEA